MKKIVFVGAPGSGKSTLAAQVFAALKTRGDNAELVDEFIRRDIGANGHMTSIWEQYRTRFKQQEQEDAVPASVDYLVSDSGTLSPYFYAVHYADPLDKRQRLVLQDMHKYFTDDLFLGRYDHVFFLPVILDSDKQDGTRFQTPLEIQLLNDHMHMVFGQLYKGPSIHVIDGEYEERFGKVMGIIDNVKRKI